MPIIAQRITSPPFSKDIREKPDTVPGNFTSVHEFDKNKNFIVKKIKNVQDLEFQEWYEYNQSENPPPLTWERLQRTVHKESRLLSESQSGIKEYIPPFQVVWGEEDDTPIAYIIMKKVDGVDVQNVEKWSAERIQKLEEFITDCLNFYEESKKTNPDNHGYLPDILEKRPDGSLGLKNIMFGTLSETPDEGDTERLYFVDTYPIFPILSDSNDIFSQLRSVLLQIRSQAGLFENSELVEILEKLYIRS